MLTRNRHPGATLHVYVSFRFANALQCVAVPRACIFRLQITLIKVFIAAFDRHHSVVPRLVWSSLLRPHHMITTNRYLRSSDAGVVGRRI